MFPETWLPTCTLTTGLSVPVAVTACVIGPRGDGDCLEILSGATPALAKQQPGENHHDDAND